MASYSDSDAATTSSLLSLPRKSSSRTTHWRYEILMRSEDTRTDLRLRRPCSVPLPRAFAILLLSRTPAAMALSTLPTSTLSSLEAMLHSLMRESGSRGGRAGGDDDDDDMPIDNDTLSSSSPPPPPLPSRPTPRGRRPSRPRRRVRVQDTWPRAPPPPLSPVEVPSYDSLLRFPYRIKHC
jgi:hypothetical protein